MPLDVLLLLLKQLLRTWAGLSERNSNLLVLRWSVPVAEGQESLAPLFLCSYCLLLGLGALGTASTELLNWEFSESIVWSASD